jgi:hypothetical protein
MIIYRFSDNLFHITKQAVRLEEALHRPTPVSRSRHIGDQGRAPKIIEDDLSTWDHYPLLLIEALK